MNPNHQFQNILERILMFGSKINTRNSDTLRIMNEMITFNRTPLISVRRTAWKSALREFEWFMSGSNNINDLHESVRKWWEPWAKESRMKFTTIDRPDRVENNVWNNYSQQFRMFGLAEEGEPFDQIQYLMDGIKTHPNSRRNVITTWHTKDMMAPETLITNCHGTVIQAFVEPNNSLHLTMYQRSCDMVLGVPHNFIQYWAFLMYLAHHGGRKVGSFTWIGGDVHIYNNHIDMAKRICNTDITRIEDIDLVYNPTSEDFKADDFTLSKKYEPIICESIEMTV